MENKHEGMIKGFTQLSKAYYGEREIKEADYEDEIVFGFYSSNEPTTTGEMSVQWVRLKEKLEPKLIIFSDAWNALANLQELINLLGEHDSESSTPEQFRQFLLECGFVDMTKTVRSKNH